MALMVEYLVIMPKNGNFCDDIETFNRLLQSDSSTKIKKGILKFKDSIECTYKINYGDITDKDQRYFHLQFQTDIYDSEDKLDDFSGLLRGIRKILTMTGGQIETLWDDISFYYSKRAYEILHETENLMRKLIANFMLITVGKDWIKETSPSEIADTISKSKRKDYVNVLHSIDFIDLAKFLLNPYSKVTPKELNEKVKEASTIEQFLRLKEDLPKSNWQRYFAKIVACEDDYLRKRWDELYNLRCKVAHNAILLKPEYSRIVELSNDLTTKLKEAIQKLPQVSVPTEERELIAENAAINIYTLFGEFLTNWKLIENYIDNKAKKEGCKKNQFRENIEWLKLHNSINQTQYYNILDLSKFRNNIVHSPSSSIADSIIQDKIRDTHSILDECETNLLNEERP